MPLPAEPADDVAERLAGELKIPPCPGILADFSAEARKDEPDTRRLVQLIATDAGLSAAILQTVNSPFYGMATKATDVRQALAILGLRGATGLISGLLLRQAFPSAAGGLMQRYWDDSTRIAQAAVAVAGISRRVSREEAHTYALFRNCGLAVMIARFADYGDVMDRHDDAPGPELALFEEARYRYNHARVGHALARGWMLPDVVARSILMHHEIARVADRAAEAAGASPVLVALGLLAEQVVRLRAGLTVTAEWSRHEAFALDILSIEPDDVVALVRA
jgi:HD-like signal output (HDOD) protein